MTSDPAEQERGKQPKAKVFISYARKDLAFADQLEAAVKARGFEALIDRTDIYAFEEWWKRIEDLIGRADTIVFVLSPDAVRPGSIALKEAAFAASLNKRLAPIVFRPVEDKGCPKSSRSSISSFSTMQRVSSKAPISLRKRWRPTSAG